MAFSSSPIQTATNATDSTFSITATFGATPTQNNLIVAICGSNDGDATNPSGYSLAVNSYDTTDDDFVRMVYKVAGAGESTSVTFTGFLGNSATLALSEWSGNATASPLDQTASQTESLGVASQTTGTTGTTSQNGELAVGAVACRADISSINWNNSFTALSDLKATGNPEVISAYRVLTATGTYSSTASWTTNGNAWGLIATFKDTGGGASSFVPLVGGPGGMAGMPLAGVGGGLVA